MHACRPPPPTPCAAKVLKRYGPDLLVGDLVDKKDAPAAAAPPALTGGGGGDDQSKFWSPDVADVAASR